VNEVQNHHRANTHDDQARDRGELVVQSTNSSI
jgi:hypothetical protein